MAKCLAKPSARLGSPRAADDASPTGEHDIEAAPAPPDRLTAADAAHVAAAIEARGDKAASTRRHYAREWRAWAAFADGIGRPALPADPDDVAAWLRSRRGQSHRTLSVAACAVAFGARITRTPSPMSSDPVAAELSSARITSPPPRQARPLDRAAATQVIAALTRRARSADAATAARALADIAAIRIMRDALLRVGETAALRWADVERRPDGTGLLRIRRSKTDPAGIGAVKALLAETIDALSRVDGAWADPAAHVVSRSPVVIARRLRAAAELAGVHGISGHSCRVGAAQDLAAAGAEMPQLMEAGRWRSPEMAARYTQQQRAARGAITRWAHAIRIPEPDPEPADA